ncbi:radial spoke head protein 9 homolog [Amphibalanus amphitrite]|uniref:radial spoke head protein 9 homolog n=1 Tax=Amphibalanus amphitrite TaxID=1232801 RepID=UPI001C912AF2|nr:radial spoke head protein 9 homolog [Amphibalanus amphitrite]
MDIGALTPSEITSCYNGLSVNVEQRAMLENSLAKLQADNKAKEMKFLGCIMGMDGDYFLAQTVGEDVLSDLKYFYSTDGCHWSLLQDCNPKLVAGASKVRGRFTGDPAHDYEGGPGHGAGPSGSPTRSTPDEEAAALGPVVKEEDRLAYVVHQLFHETAIVPRKALMYTASGTVIKNPSFKGLSSVEGDQLESYFHLRVPASDPMKRTAADADLTIDFLEPLSQDPFKAAWSVNRCQGGRLVVIRNHTWPGAVFYHRLGTTDHGFCYMGTGQQNLDVPFMLPSSRPPPPPGLVIDGDIEDDEEEGGEEEGEEEEEEEGELEEEADEAAKLDEEDVTEKPDGDAGAEPGAGETPEEGDERGAVGEGDAPDAEGAPGDEASPTEEGDTPPE